MEKIKELLKNKVFLWCAIGVAVVLVAAILAIVLLGGNTGDPNDGTTPSGGADVTYAVQVNTNAGAVLSGIDVYVYADSTLADMVAVTKTDENGLATFTAPAGTYAVVLKGVPAGYPLESSYPVSEAETAIVLTATLIADADLSKDTFGRNDVMFDFTVTDTEGNAYTLSQLLQQKKAVVLNFWFANCNPCKAEFPYLQEAYENFSEDIALIAVNPVDDAAAVAGFRTEQGLTIPMASVDAAWADAMKLSAYPTTVVIDRFGNINMVHVGSVPNTELFENMFSYYASENYAQQSGLALEDFAAASEEGSEANPLEFGGVTEFEVTVKPGASVYVDAYKVNGMVLTVQDETVNITYDENTYAPENGSVSLMVYCPDNYTPAKLVFTNTGAEEKTYKAVLTFPVGTMGNPFQLELGSFTVDALAGNDQGVYYTYVAEESGELTLKCVGVTEGVEYTFTLYNLDTYVYLVPEEDTLTIAVNKGDTVQFTAGALPNEDNEYPAATLDFVASFEEKEVDTPHPTDATEPLPTDPAVTDPAPTTPAPTTPAPTTPAPTTPAPTNPAPTTPAPTTPAPTTPAPTEPQPEELEYTEIYNGEIRVYLVNEGSRLVGLTAGEMTYFMFTPDRAGQYRFTVNAGTLSYYGNNLSYIEHAIVTDGATDQSFVENIKEGHLGSSYVIAVDAPAGVSKCTLEIQRIGDPVLGWEDMEYTVYTGTYTPVQQTAPTGTLTYVKVNGKVAENTPVLGDDGFYYLNGKLLYINLTAGKYPDMALNTKLNGDYPFIRGYVKDANGENIAKEEYTDLVLKYIECSADGLYPVTEDMMRILKTQSDSWYLYLSGSLRNVKQELAWMCNVCYVE